MESPDGFLVRVREQRGPLLCMEYAEGDHVYSFSAEAAVSCWIVFLSDIVWESPYEKDKISADRTQEIHHRISEALRVLEIPARIDFEPDIANRGRQQEALEGLRRRGMKAPGRRRQRAEKTPEES